MVGFIFARVMANVRSGGLYFVIYLFIYFLLLERHHSLVLGPLQAKSTVGLDFDLQDINLIPSIVPGETWGGGGQEVEAGQKPQGGLHLL